MTSPSIISKNPSLLENCRDFITIVKTPKPHYINKATACAQQILSSDITPVSSPDTTREFQEIKENLVNLSPKNAKIKKIVTQVFEKLYPSTPSPSKINSIVPAGMQNMSGNDCFLIALCQLLRTPSLTQHLVNRLPKELWEPLIADNSNAEFIRKAIVEHTPFGATVSQNVRANPLTAQLDPGEVLAFLFNRIDEPDLATPIAIPQTTTTPPVTPVTVASDISTTASEPTLKEIYEEKYKNETNLLKRPLLFLSFWITTIFKSIENFFVSSLLGVFGYSETPPESSHSHADPNPMVIPDKSSPKYVPIITANRPNRPIKTDLKENIPNPLDVRIKKIRTYTPNPGVPDYIIHHDNFGGISNRTECQETQPYLDLPLKKNSDGFYTLQDVLHDYFAGTNEDEPSSVVIQSDSGDTITYEAKREESMKLTAIPDHLLLSFKRSLSLTDKIRDPIEGIDLEFILPNDLSEIAVDEKDRTYVLQGFLCHLGSSSIAGHYISYRKEADGWHYFNDSTHKVVSEAEVKEAAKHSYTLLYERKK